MQLCIERHWRSVVMHENHLLLESCRFLLVLLVEQGALKELLWVDFHTMFYSEGANHLTVDNFFPYRDFSTILLPSEPTWGIPWAIQPRAHPSGPSKITLTSSIQNTLLKSIFMYFWAHCRRFSLCYFFRGGRVCTFFTLETLQSTMHLVLWGTPGKPQLVKMAKLVCGGFLLTSLFIPQRSFSLSFHLFFSTLFFRPSCKLRTKCHTVLQCLFQS